MDFSLIISTPVHFKYSAPKMNLPSFAGRAMAQEVSRRPLTAEAWVRSRPIPVAVRSTAWVCGRPLTGIVGSNPAGGMDVCVVFVV